MSKEKEKNCRLCLEFLDDYYTVIEESTREIFEFLLLKMDLSISEEPLVCKSCMESVQAAFKFKSTCIFVDEQVVSLARGRNSAELDIRDVYLNGNENKGLAFNEEYNICRFCLQCLENFNLLNDLRNNSTQEKLLKCIPELEMNLIKEPMVCTACMISLEAYYSFAVKCQNIEENIMKYCEVQRPKHNGQISLNNVLKFIIKGMPDCIDNCSKAATFKEDNMFQNEGNTYSDINNIVIKLEKEELILKDENMYGDCKTEKDRCGETSQKEVVKYNMVTHRNSSDVIKFRRVTKQKRSLKVPMPTCKDESDVTIYNCNLCSYTAKLKSHLNGHILTHKDSDMVIYRCEKCMYRTKNKGHLNRHMIIHKDSSEMTMYKCNLCNHKTKRKDYLASHMLTHKDSSDAVIYRCEKCTFKTKYKGNIQKHMLIHKDESEVTMYKCNICNYEAKRKYHLEGHMLIHKNSAEVIMYRCEKCTFETRHKRNLKGHMLTHKDKSEKTRLTHKDESEITIHKCNLCNFETKWKNALKNHLLIHKDSSDVIMYRCEKCTFETKYKSCIKNHILTHKDKSEVTMYKCNLCNYETKWKQYLRTHMLNHKNSSSAIKYRCKKCTYETKYRVHLRRHMLTHKASQK